MRASNPLRLRIVTQNDARFDPLTRWLLFDDGPAVASGIPEPQLNPPLSGGRYVLIQAERGGRACGAVLAGVNPDGTAEAVPPRVDDSKDLHAVDLLLSGLTDQLRQQDVRLITLYVPTDRPGLPERLFAAGYRQTSDLLLLAAETGGAVRSEQKDGWLIRPYVPAQRERFRRALAASAADALDFPDLQIDVATDLRLQRLAETGISGERLWYLVERQGEEAGCLLLADQPEWDRCELVYLGLEASQRGRGVGRWLARHAVWQARQAGRSHLIAGVDAANDPAVAVYAAAGFVQAGRRHVFYRALTSS